MKRLKRIAWGVLALVGLVLLVGLSYEQWSRMRAERVFPPPGELIQVNGRQAHLFCTGEGSPTVILEAGLDPFGTQVWGAVQPAIATMTRVCSYDRAGIMWSDPGPEPRDAHQIADELGNLLEAAGESPPYVMVGHSLGGLLQLVYDARHPEEVGGFVFVDSSHPRQMERVPKAVLEGMEACMPPSLLIKVTARTGYARIAGLMTGEGLPEESRGAASAFGPQSTIGLLGESQALEVIASQTEAQPDLGSRPVVVLSAGVHDAPECAGIDDEAARQMEEIWAELQGEIATFSTNSEQRVMENSPHYVQLQAPEAVIDAVRDVVTAVRRGPPVGSQGPVAEGKVP